MEIENDVFDFGEIKTDEKAVENTENTAESQENIESQEADEANEVVKVEEKTVTTDAVEDNDDVLKTTFDHFKEIKVLPETAEFDGTEEGFVSAFKSSVKDEVLDEVWNSLPTDEGKALLEYMLNGGTDINKFKETFGKSWEKFEFSDNETEKAAQQKEVLVEYYKSKGFSDKKAEKEADLKIQFAEADDASTEALEELKVVEKTTKENLIKEQKAANEKAQKAYQEEVNSFVKVLKETKDINGVPVTDKERNQIFNLYYGTTKTEQGDVPNLNLLLNSILSDTEKSLKFAQFIFGGLSTEGTKKAAKTEVVKGLKDKLRATSEGQTKQKGSVQQKSGQGLKEIIDIG